MNDPTLRSCALSMLRFDVITLFPEFFDPWSRLGVCGRAVQNKQVQLVCWNPRQFVSDPHQTIDDRPYGGGPGMVMMAPPLADAVLAIQTSLRQAAVKAGPVILMSPAGQSLNQAWIESQVQAAGPKQMTLVCGRYEGIDQRFIDRYVDLEISLGDFVISGGEIAALALMDGLVRRLEGVLHDQASSTEESFMQDRLDHPHYTRPEVFEGESVPSVLLSGHHGKIADWRFNESIKLTTKRRPDLIKK